MPEYAPTPRNRRNDALPQQGGAQSMLAPREGLELLNRTIAAIYMALNQKHIVGLQKLPVIPFASSASNADLEDYTTLYRVEKILYNEKENSHEKLVSVFSALHNYVSSIAMAIASDGKEISLYLCTYATESGGIAGSLLESNIRGQFPGSKLSKLSNFEKSLFFKSLDINDSKIIRSVSVIPGKRQKEESQNRDFTSQGFEKLIDSLEGKKYTLLVVSQSVPPSVVDDCKTALENLATLISPYKDESVSYALNESSTVGYSFSNNFSNAVNESISMSFGTSHTDGISSGSSYSKSYGSAFNFNGWGSNSGTSSGTSSGSSASDAVSENRSTVSGTVLSTGSSTGANTGETKGFTQTYNVTRENKSISGLLETIDDHLERISTSRIYGMWNCSCYLFTEDIATASISSSTLQSLLTSDSTISAEVYCNHWSKEKDSADVRKALTQYIKNFQHPQFSCSSIAVPVIGGTASQTVTPGLMVSGNELPIIMGLPKKSVPGVTVASMAEFGRNVPTQVSRPIRFGQIQHMGAPDIGEAFLDANVFSSHCFITGSSGSGKSNATYGILKNLCDSGVKFLVIEPTKGEYKSVFGNWRTMFPKNAANKVNIFTTNPRQCRMLRINPFEFHARVHIQEHISRLVGAISACWPLEGAMPAFLKKAFEGAYIKNGWDLNHSLQVVKGDKEFPDFSDLEDVMAEIIKTTDYSAEVKGNYQGALLTRISAMTNGFEGQIFCSNRGVSDKTLFDENCIVDLSNIGSQETRALIMGLLIIRLKEYRYAVAREANSQTKHVTVLEEAHNILKRCPESGQSSILTASVEMLTASIAEMRTYGEGFLIVDQSPSAVDATAIKNTAIKIVLRLPEEQDCKEIGNALALTEDQTRELSRLDIGVAAVFHPGWNETVLAKSDIFNPVNSKGEKKYPEKSVLAVNHVELIQMRGLAVSMLFNALKEHKLNPDFKDELVDLMSEKCLKDCKSLSDGKLDELIEIISGFFNTLSDSSPARARQLLFSFAIDFLQIKDLFGILPLRSNEPKEKMFVGWHNQFQKALAYYIQLPGAKGPAMDRELKEISSGIIEAYSLMAEKKNHKEFMECWTYLTRQGCFK